MDYQKFLITYRGVIMINENQEAWVSSLRDAFKEKIRLGTAVLLLGTGQQAFAHVEYYDLNSGKQVGDLTAAGKAASTVQYGSTPAAVVALGGVAANGLGVISSQVDMPLNNPAQWNATYQSYTGVGAFTNVTYTPTSSTASVSVNDVTDFGWGAGTTALLGNSHDVDFFNFRLSNTSTVTITWNVNDAFGNFYDNGFSLYKGFLSYQGHDTGNETSNPTNGPGVKVQDALDALNAPVDAQGIASAYRNTTSSGPGSYVGQFNALANWGQSNVAGNWSNVSFIQAVNKNTHSSAGYSTNASDTLETLTIQLLAGNYTIAASGALSATPAAGGFGVASFGGTNLHGVLTYNAAAVATVPVPGAVWLFGSAMAGMIGLGRRKQTLVA